MAPGRARGRGVFRVLPGALTLTAHRHTGSGGLRCCPTQDLVARLVLVLGAGLIVEGPLHGVAILDFALLKAGVKRGLLRGFRAFATFVATRSEPMFLSRSWV